MLRIGITQRVEVIAAYGERRDCLDQAWTPLLLAQGMFPVPLPNTVAGPGALLEALELDGAILSGGNDLAHLPGARTPAPERDQLERALIDLCGERELPLLGVCRGMQILVAHHGGELAPLEDHVAKPHALRVADPGLLPKGLSLESREQVNSFHDWGVPAGGEGEQLAALAFAPDGSVEAVAHRRLPQWGIMWHPERPPQHAADGALLRTVFGGGG